MIYSDKKKHLISSKETSLKEESHKIKKNKSNIVFLEREDNDNNDQNMKKDVIQMMYMKKMIKCIPLMEEKKKILDHLVLFDTVKQNIKVKVYEWEKGKGLNEKVWNDWNEPCDLYIFSFEKKEKTYYENMIKNIPKYPIYLNGDFYITPILFYFVDGFSNTEKNKDRLIEDFQLRIIKQLGLIIGRESQMKFRKNERLDIKTGFHDFYPKNSILHDPCVFKIQPWMTRNFKKNNFGWFNKMNQFAIDYVFENYEIDTIAEFGVYLGYSSRYILSKKPKMKYYGFDIFRPLQLTKYSSNKIMPLDSNFFFKYLRFETFHRNISKYENVTTIVGDIYKNYELLKMYKIEIQFFYIDFEKKTDPLYHFVMNILDDYPNAIIVGDDYMFMSVKKAVEKMKNSNLNVIGLKSCYIVSKRPLKRIEMIQKKYEEYMKYINEEDIDKIKEFPIIYKVLYVKRMMKEKEDINKIVDTIQLFHIDVNRKYNILGTSNIYHILGKMYYNDEKYYIKLYEELSKIEKDRDIKDVFNLTSKDYMKTDMRVGIM